ncbi:tyrosinase family oxidase copper chaperone [Streptomyces sp. SudanB182_2057]|uniref:tyrosinase family oxidase copper chaperone n=1 Tax=Streptomyces sp. SudanB182_2057 TaxID=3035281 RepID=UPI003F54D7A0
MVVGVGEVAVGPHQEAGVHREAGAGAAGRSRREVARGLLASAAALALTPVVAASRPVRPAGPADDGVFDETYRGRRIQGFLVPAVGRQTAGTTWRITVDGRPLHLMRRADGSWLSMVDHYTSYRTPLEATRAAVDEMGPGRRLREPTSADPTAGHPGGHAHTGGRHGVRA